MDQDDGFTLKAFLVALGLLLTFFLGVAWWGRGRFDNDSGSSSLSAQAETLSPNDSTRAIVSPVTTSLPTPEISWGDRILVTTSTNRHKAAGVDAIASRDYTAAVSALETARSTEPADPETLIYLNNARIGAADAYAIAAAVPAEASPAIANSILRGIAQAQTEINQMGGIQGKPLRIAIVDDQNSSVFAKELATKLVKTPEILGVIGHNSTPAAAAAAEIYNNQLLALVPTNTTLNPADLNEYALPTLSSDPLVAGAIAFYLFELGRAKAALFYHSRSDHSRLLKSQFETALAASGGTLMGQANLVNPDDLLAPNIAKLKTAEALVIFPSSDVQITTLKQIVDITQDQDDSTYTPVFGGYELFSPAILDQLGDAADGTILAIPNEIYASAASPFSNSPQMLWGQPVDWRTTSSYNATQSMIAGLRKAPTRDGLKQLLYTENSDMPRGVRLIKVEVQPGTETRYELVSLGFLAKEDIFVPE